MADLIAVILAPETLNKRALQEAIDRRREQVQSLARQYYKLHPCDFDNSADKAPTVGSQNRARLDRANLR